MLKKLFGFAIIGLAIYGAYMIYLNNQPATA